MVKMEVSSAQARDSKQVEHGKNTDDDKMMKVYDEVWHQFKHRRLAGRQSGKKQCEVFLGVAGVQLADVP
jgi:hypothetical protein